MVFHYVKDKIRILAYAMFFMICFLAPSQNYLFSILLAPCQTTCSFSNVPYFSCLFAFVCTIPYTWNVFLSSMISSNTLLNAGIISSMKCSLIFMLYVWFLHSIQGILWLSIHHIMLICLFLLLENELAGHGECALNLSPSAFVMLDLWNSSFIHSFNKY